ncbi:unnamed protein product [Amoebophrya sp. A25]|nr:unnamed protein product [Amoebophrya sp. A25]|eukprot:GSA25T00026456001.1
MEEQILVVSRNGQVQAHALKGATSGSTILERWSCPSGAGASPETLAVSGNGGVFAVSQHPEKALLFVFQSSTMSKTLAIEEEEQMLNKMMTTSTGGGVGVSCSSLFQDQTVATSKAGTSGSNKMGGSGTFGAAPFYRASLPEKLGCMLFSACGEYLFAGSESGKIYVWHVRTGQLVNCFPHAHYQAVATLALSPSDDLLVSGSQEGGVAVWTNLYRKNQSSSQSNELRRWTGHTLGVTKVLFCEDGGSVVSGSLDHSVRQCDIFTGRELRNFQLLSPVHSLALGPSGDLYAGLSRGCVKKLCLGGVVVSAPLSSSTTTSTRSTTPSSGVVDFILPAVGGGQHQDIEAATSTSTAATQAQHLAITSMSLSYDGCFLVVSDGVEARIYDTRGEEVAETGERKMLGRNSTLLSPAGELQHRGAGAGGQLVRTIKAPSSSSASTGAQGGSLSALSASSTNLISAVHVCPRLKSTGTALTNNKLSIRNSAASTRTVGGSGEAGNAGKHKSMKVFQATHAPTLWRPLQRAVCGNDVSSDKAASMLKRALLNPLPELDDTAMEESSTTTRKRTKRTHVEVGGLRAGLQQHVVESSSSCSSFTPTSTTATNTSACAGVTQIMQQQVQIEIPSLADAVLPFYEKEKEEMRERLEQAEQEAARWKAVAKSLYAERSTKSLAAMRSAGA